MTGVQTCALPILIVVIIMFLAVMVSLGEIPGVVWEGAKDFGKGFLKGVSFGLIDL